MDAIASGLGRYVDEEHVKRQNWDNEERERILRVWFRKTPLDMEKKKAVIILAKIFEKQDVNLTSLARKLKQKLSSCSDIFRKDDVEIVPSLIKDSYNVFKTLLLIIGKTGEAKSCLCNSLSGHAAKSDIFPLSPDPKPCTNKETLGTVKLDGNHEE